MASNDSIDYDFWGIKPPLEWIDPPAPRSVDDSLYLQQQSAEDVLAEIEKDRGERFTETERAEYLPQIMEGNFTLRDVAKADIDYDFWGIPKPGAKDAPDPKAGNYLTGGVVLPKSSADQPTISDFLMDRAAAILGYGEAAKDAAVGSLTASAGRAIRFATDENNPASALTAPAAKAAGLYGAIVGDQQSLADKLAGGSTVDEAGLELTEEAGRSTESYGKKRSAEAQAYRDREGIGQGLDKGLSIETAMGVGLDVAANPDMAITQIAALVPGPAGQAAARVLAGMPAGRVFLDEYYSLVDKGVPSEEAKARAAVMAGIEYAAEAAPGGKAGGAAVRAVTSTGRKIATTAGKEALQEAGTELGQGGLDTFITAMGVGSKELQAAAEQGDFDSAKDAAKRATYAGIVGSVAAGGSRAVIAPFETAAEVKAQTGKVTDAGTRKGLDTMLGIQTENEQRQEAERVEKERIAQEQAAAERQVLEAEAAKLTVAKQDAENKRAKKAKESPATIEPVSVETMLAERKQAKEAADAKAEQSRVAKLATELKRRKAAVAAADKKAAEAKVKKDAAALVKHKATLQEQAVRENPEATPEQLVKIYESKLAANPTPAPSRQKGKRGRTTVPARTPKVAATPVAAPAVAPAPARTAAEQGSIDTVVEALGLKKPGAKAMAADPRAAPRPQSAETQRFVAKTKAIVNGIVKRNTNPDVDVQELITQGKINFAPNAKAIGRKDVSPDGKDVGQFDEDGTMWLFTDHIDEKNPNSAIMVALHESTHTGQENKRKGRNSIMDSLMDTDAQGKAAKKIRAAAKGGNKVAQAAVRKAARTGDDETLELVPYFVSEATKARQGFGQLGGVVRDIKAAARGFVRDRVGLDVDISLDEIDAATQKVAGEIVKTDVKKGASSPLAMIGGQEGTNFDKADFIYRGLVDGKLRYEFSDEEANIDIGSEAFEKFSEGERVSLDTILVHDELYENYPQLRTLPIYLNKESAGTNLKGTFHGLGKGISINPDIIYFGSDLLSTVLHEVQHAVQRVEGFVPGANSKYLIDPRLKPAADEAQQTYDSTLKKFEYGAAVKSLPPHIREKWDAYTKRPKPEGWNTESDQVAFLRGPFADEVTDRIVKEQIKNYRWADKQRKETKDALRKAESESFKLYIRDYGETEARNTEFRRTMTKAQRDAERPESTMVKAREKVPVENTVDTRTVAKAGSEQFGSESQEAPPTHEIVNVSTGKVVDTATSLADAIEKVEQLGGGDKYWARKIKAPALAMAADSAPLARRVPVWVSRLLSSSGGIGRKAREITEFARTSPAQERMIAEATYDEYQRGVHELAAERGTTPEDITKEIVDALDKVDNQIDGHEENMKAFVDVASKYGRAGEALIKFRVQTDRLTEEILRDRLAEGTPLTEGERDTFQTMLNNMGRYSHRQYAIHMGKGGKKFASRILKDYAKYKKANGDVPDSVRKNYERVARAVRYLIDNQLMIPDDAGLADMDAKQTLGMFREWANVSNPDTLTTEEQKDELARIRDAVNGDENTLEATAERIVEQILATEDPDSLIAQSFRPGRINKGILKERSAIPEEIRDLMGEIKDPDVRMFATVAKQAEFIARQRMLLELRDQAGPAHVQPPGASGRPEVKGMSRLDGDTYGALQGHFVSPQLKTELQDYIQLLATFEQAVAMAAARPNVLEQYGLNKAAKAWSKIVGFTKMMQIIYKPVNFIFNALGGGITMVINGNIDPRTFLKAARTALGVIAYARNPGSADTSVRRVTAAGVTDSAFVGEITGELYKELSKTLKTMQGDSPTHPALQWFKDANMTFKEAYAMMDVTYKIANFYHQADSVLPAYYEAAGIEKTQEEIDREAADIVNDTNVTYKRAAPIVKGLEKAGLSNFGVFFYEVFRSQINNVRQGVKELERAQNAPNEEAASIMRKQGAKRITGQLVAWSFLATMSRFLASAAFGDDDDDKNGKDDRNLAEIASDMTLRATEQEAAKRAQMAPFAQGQDFIPVGTDKDGNKVYFDVSRIDPIGPISDLMRGVLNGKLDPETVAENIFRLYVAPRVGVQAIRALGLGEERRPAKPMLQQWFPEAYSKFLNAANAVGVEDRSTKAMTNVIETAYPGITAGYKDTNTRPLMETPGSTIAALMTYGGGTMFKLDGQRLLTSATYDYKDVVSDNRGKIKDIFVDHPDATAEEVVSRLSSMQDKERDAYEDVQEVYHSMVVTGTPQRTINVQLKNMGLNAKQIKSLREGEFEFTSVSRASIDEIRRKEIKAAKTAEEKARVKEKWNTAWQLLKISKDELSEEEQ